MVPVRPGPYLETDAVFFDAPFLRLMQMGNVIGSMQLEWPSTIAFVFQLFYSMYACLACLDAATYMCQACIHAASKIDWFGRDFDGAVSAPGVPLRSPHGPLLFCGLVLRFWVYVALGFSLQGQWPVLSVSMTLLLGPCSDVI